MGCALLKFGQARSKLWSRFSFGLVHPSLLVLITPLRSPTAAVPTSEWDMENEISKANDLVTVTRKPIRPNLLGSYLLHLTTCKAFSLLSSPKDH
ncbi:hypothetical protein CROQUDRAFT_94823 [Cronartium quercuum f. sp. fusiforme G11]|uniref:Uncharacterized protein n=1 Tax=Cronartium quercuum f. sp. fusiforme G11 TaxID=708437 RepID=A0A9P6NDF1_9BASI|nr:hypothetical protein CROQUDRAFT_94823 [Cronartium quercuum f. sp. fusiforme G11]